MSSFGRRMEKQLQHKLWTQRSFTELKNKKNTETSHTFEEIKGKSSKIKTSRTKSNKKFLCSKRNNRVKGNLWNERKSNYISDKGFKIQKYIRNFISIKATKKNNLILKSGGK